MTDLSTLLLCFTALIISIQVLRFLKWYFKNKTDICNHLEMEMLDNSELRVENHALRKQLEAAKSPFSDINEKGGDK